MFVPGLPSALWRAVHLTQGFTRCCVTRNVWKSGRCRTFSRSPDESDSDGVKKPRPKTVSVPKITLVSPDNSVTVIVLEEAQRLAKRRNLNLIKISDLDSKTHRPTYKLVSGTGVLENTEDDDEIVTNVERIGQKLTKAPKLFYIAAKITEHDLQTKTKNITRLLNKGHKIKIVITLDGMNGDEVQKCIEDAVRNIGSIQKMPSKKNTILFLINPILKNEDTSAENKSKTGS
ncbi:hypothetical protein PUN28_009459 [Cardiocondyla obscurior]